MLALRSPQGKVGSIKRAGGVKNCKKMQKIAEKMQRFAKICKKLQKKYTTLHNFSPSTAFLIENFLNYLPHFFNLIIFAAIDSKQPKLHLIERKTAFFLIYKSF